MSMSTFEPLAELAAKARADGWTVVAVLSVLSLVVILWS